MPGLASEEKYFAIFEGDCFAIRTLAKIMVPSADQLRKNFKQRSIEKTVFY